MGRNNPNDKSVPDMGKIVSDLLESKHMTQADLAKKLGWYETAITGC